MSPTNLQSFQAEKVLSMETILKEMICLCVDFFDHSLEALNSLLVFQLKFVLLWIIKCSFDSFCWGTYIVGYWNMLAVNSLALDTKSLTLRFPLLKTLGKIFSRSSNMLVNFSLKAIQTLSKVLDVSKQILFALNKSSKQRFGILELINQVTKPSYTKLRHTSSY